MSVSVSMFPIGTSCIEQRSEITGIVFNNSVVRGRCVENKLSSCETSDKGYSIKVTIEFKGHCLWSQMIVFVYLQYICVEDKNLVLMCP